nr:anhydro-N-acetylmuramic acid kinase [Cellvibrio japonicus]
MDKRYFVGLMSGTSADAIDAVLVEPGNPPHLLASHSVAIPPQLRAQIHALSLPGTNEIDRLGSLDIELAELFARAVHELLQSASCHAGQIAAIGSHGQTIRHRPPQHNDPTYTGKTFTLQIGDPNTLAQLTGITTVADFRRRDMAAGGQGAPLVPAFHRTLFTVPGDGKDRVIVNIGGMANITWLGKEGSVMGFDTGPGNVLMDAWTQLHRQQPFDRDGVWAASGNIDSRLLNTLLEHPFFSLPAPKSTGREEFNLPWLEKALHKLPLPLSATDIQATLLALTVKTIAQPTHNLSHSAKEVILCGGGAYNRELLGHLRNELPNDTVCTSQDKGIAPEWIEAMAFAWLAEQTLNRRPGNLCAVTGARQEVILGGVYYA